MDRSPLADDLRAQLRAEAMLAKLDVLEDLAQVHDSEDIQAVRTRLADQYREVVGILPQERHEFRNALLQLVQGDSTSNTIAEGE